MSPSLRRWLETLRELVGAVGKQRARALHDALEDLVPGAMLDDLHAVQRMLAAVSGLMGAEGECLDALPLEDQEHRRRQAIAFLDWILGGEHLH